MLTGQNVVAKLASFVEICGFPCSKQELLKRADEQQFPDEIMDALEDLPNRKYSCESAVVEAARSAAQPRTCPI